MTEDDWEQRKKCAELKKYQGWTNYETWAVGLWIDNEYPVYSEVERMATEKAKTAKDDKNVKEGIWTECEAARFNLADQIKDMVEENNPLAEKADLYSDILRANLSEVNWHEIAESHLEGKIVCKKKE